MFPRVSLPLFLMVLSFTLLTGGCSLLGEGEQKYPTGADRAATGGNDIYSEAPSVFGKEGIFGSRSTDDDGKGTNGVEVNSYLWRAALDTVSFMPLASADPFGGVILTDWYTDPAAPNERTKLNVFILGRELKAEGVRVKAFRQIQKGGTWKDAAVGADTGRKLEDAILTRARQMRVAKEESGIF